MGQTDEHAHTYVHVSPWHPMLHLGLSHTRHYNILVIITNMLFSHASYDNLMLGLGVRTQTRAALHQAERVPSHALH